MSDSDWVIPRGGFVVLTLVGLLILGVERLVAERIEDSATRTAVTCTVKGPRASSSGSFVHLAVDCAGRELIVAEGTVIVSYLKRPGPLQCETTAKGSITCEPRPE